MLQPASEAFSVHLTKAKPRKRNNIDSWVGLSYLLGSEKPSRRFCMASKGRQHFEIQVTTTHSEFAGVHFGPFASAGDAAAALRKKGWIENVNGEEGLWYCAINHYTGINARIIPVALCFPSEIPICFPSEIPRGRNL